MFERTRYLVIRGTILNTGRTYGRDRNLCMLLFLRTIYLVWSYLLLSPVIVILLVELRLCITGRAVSKLAGLHHG